MPVRLHVRFVVDVIGVGTTLESDVTAIDGIVRITVGDAFGRRTIDAIVVGRVTDADAIGTVNVISTGSHSLRTLSTGTVTTLLSVDSPDVPMPMLVVAQLSAAS